MNVKSIIAVLLIIFGVVVLAYSGLSFTTPGENVEVLGLNIQTEDKHFIPPLFGAISLVGGIVLLFIKPRGF